jgi:hypothetical protein
MKLQDCSCRLSVGNYKQLPLCRWACPSHTSFNFRKDNHHISDGAKPAGQIIGKISSANTKLMWKSEVGKDVKVSSTTAPKADDDDWDTSAEVVLLQLKKQL